MSDTTDKARAWDAIAAKNDEIARLKIELEVTDLAQKEAIAACNVYAIENERLRTAMSYIFTDADTIVEAREIVSGALQMDRA